MDDFKNKIKFYNKKEIIIRDKKREKEDKY